jgi:hypothetical protein
MTNHLAKIHDLSVNNVLALFEYEKEKKEFTL